MGQYNPEDPLTNRRDSSDEIHEIREVVNKLSGGSWLQKNGALMIGLTAYALAAIVGYVSMDIQVDSNTLAINEKTDTKLLNSMFDNHSQQIRNLKDTHVYDMNNNTKRFDKLDNKLDKSNELLQRLLINTQK